MRKLNLTTKATIALIALVIIALVASGVRAYLDQREEAAARAVDAEQEEVETVAYGVRIEGVDDEAAELFGGTARLEKLEEMVGKWCSTNVPEATTATWDGVVVYDYKARSVRATYLLDNVESTLIDVTAFMDSGEFTVTKAVG